jgi:hypothetical protein
MKSMPFYNFYKLLSGFSNLPQEAMLISILLFNLGKNLVTRTSTYVYPIIAIFLARIKKKLQLSSSFNYSPCKA